VLFWSSQINVPRAPTYEDPLNGQTSLHIISSIISFFNTYFKFSLPITRWPFRFLMLSTEHVYFDLHLLATQMLSFSQSRLERHPLTKRIKFKSFLTIQRGDTISTIVCLIDDKNIQFLCPDQLKCDPVRGEARDGPWPDPNILLTRGKFW